jgi:SecD/SecF fusion protein
MKRFLNRIIICLLPVVVSAVVIAWAYGKYEDGQGGFRLGVDLAGGTLLVYEVDETKMPQDFKPEDLAAALKRRIDPADLLNVTIRPVAGTPPRVEIVLPTGGQKQARAEENHWQELLRQAARQFPVEGEDPYGEVEKGDKLGLRALIEQKYGKTHPDVTGDKISAWIDAATGSGGGDRRLLTSEEVENIKNLIERQGRLEFRILANNQDDEEGIKAAEEWLKDPKNLPALEQAEVRNEPPPPPRNKEDGSTRFTVKLSNGSVEQHSYSWVELGKSELYSLGLNSDALARPEGAALRRQVEEARQKHEAFSLPGRLNGCILYTRKITDWSRRLPKDKRQGKEYEYFVLVRDPIKGQEITGDYLVSAREGQARGGSELAIDFTFNNEGGNLFYDVTSKNKPTGDRETGFKRHLAIIFDGQIASAPTLNEPIRTNGQIHGRFTQQEVQDMVRILRAGALPATLKKEPVSQNTMGATLGEVTIDHGTKAVLLSFVAVMAFMVFYYRFAGLIACLALLANLLLTVAFMVVVQAAFTLPGLAGLVLMLGMAVDANVLIYERLREERDRGANLALALRNGYDRAFPTIIDTHLSSIFTAIVLYVVGNDQLKGFGISLTVGLIISLFTSLYMTRTLFEFWLAKGWLKDLSFFGGLVRLIHARYWDFMAIRYYWFTGTVVLTILGAALFVWRFDSTGQRPSVLNIDFIGGTAYTAQLAKPMNLEELRKRLAEGEAPLPDLSIEQIFVGASAGAEGKSDYFTIRTSEKRVPVVLDYVNARLGPDLKRINLHWEVLTPTQALLSFTDPTDPTAYALRLAEPLSLEELSGKLEGGKSPLPHLEVKPAAGDQAAGRKTRAFTLHTSEGSAEKVRASLGERLGKNLKGVEKGAVAFASPAQVAMLVSKELARLDLPQSGFQVEKIGKGNRQDHYSELKLKLSEPVPPDKAASVLEERKRHFEADLRNELKLAPGSEEPVDRAEVAKVLQDLRSLVAALTSPDQAQKVLEPIQKDLAAASGSMTAQERTERVLQPLVRAVAAADLAKVPAAEKPRRVLEAVLADVQREFARAPQPERLENFDRQLAANTQERALYAILASWAAILLYLWFRFGSWTFGAATVLCLIHDLFFTLGVIAGCHYIHGTWLGNLLLIEDFKIDLSTVAALLTLVGYSVSDTIVVFDRIREVRGKNPLLTPKIINDSVNQTLTRTILSSTTVWLVVIVLYLWGGEGVHLFAFVMVVGVIVGTYSSIYIASPLLLIFIRVIRVIRGSSVFRSPCRRGRRCRAGW